MTYSSKIFNSKHILILLVSIMFSIKGWSQLTIDPALTGATIIASGAENREYDAIHSAQNAIKTAQDATALAVAQVNQIQNKIYSGLQQVSAVVKNLYQVKGIKDCVVDIIKYEGDMMEEAKKNPLALAFAVKIQSQMVEKAYAYGAEVSAFVLKAGSKELLMNAGERGLLLDKILQNLTQLKILAAYSYYKVHLAVMQGIINSINPFKGYIDLDGKIVNDIVSKWHN